MMLCPKHHQVRQKQTPRYPSSVCLRRSSAAQARVVADSEIAISTTKHMAGTFGR